MQNAIDLTPVLQVVVSLGATIITVMVIPYIKSKTTTERQAQLKSWARVGVAAAEQMFSGSGRGSEKRKYVVNFLNSKGFDVDLETVNALIESEVNQLWTGELIAGDAGGEP